MQKVQKTGGISIDFRNEITNVFTQNDTIVQHTERRRTKADKKIGID